MPPTIKAYLVLLVALALGMLWVCLGMQADHHPRKHILPTFRTNYESLKGNHEQP